MLFSPPPTVPKSALTVFGPPASVDSPPPAIVAPVALFVTVLPLHPPITLELVMKVFESVTFSWSVSAPLIVTASVLLNVKTSVLVLISRIFNLPGPWLALFPVARISQCLPPEPVVWRSRPAPTPVKRDSTRTPVWLG